MDYFNRHQAHCDANEVWRYMLQEHLTVDNRLHFDTIVFELKKQCEKYIKYRLEDLDSLEDLD